MSKTLESGISRRDFARRVAAASAATLLPSSALPIPAATAESSPSPTQQQPADATQLSPQSQAEADARYQAILDQYGSRFSEAQKTNLHLLCHDAQAPLDRLRAYHVENSDDPALYLKPLVEREKKPAVGSATPLPVAVPKKP
jgi:hypothetical protein